MSDPAIEAAQRAMKSVHGYPDPNRDMVTAAREALKPIRELHAEWVASLTGAPTVEATVALAVLDDFAKLIYPTEELER